MLNKMFAEELKKIDPPIRESISEVVYTPSDINAKKITIYMNDGNQVIGLYDNISILLNYYPTMVESVEGELGVFNLETGAYFRPFSSEYKMQKIPDTEDEESGESDESEAADEAEMDAESEPAGPPVESSQ